MLTATTASSRTTAWTGDWLLPVLSPDPLPSRPTELAEALLAADRIRDTTAALVAVDLAFWRPMRRNAATTGDSIPVAHASSAVAGTASALESYLPQSPNIYSLRCADHHHNKEGVDTFPQVRKWRET